MAVFLESMFFDAQKKLERHSPERLYPEKFVNKVRIPGKSSTLYTAYTSLYGVAPSLLSPHFLKALYIPLAIDVDFSVFRS